MARNPKHIMFLKHCTVESPPEQHRAETRAASPSLRAFLSKAAPCCIWRGQGSAQPAHIPAKGTNGSAGCERGLPARHEHSQVLFFPNPDQCESKEPSRMLRATMGASTQAHYTTKAASLLQLAMEYLRQREAHRQAEPTAVSHHQKQSC